MILCLEQSVDLDVDLLLVEFTLNDGCDDKLYHNRVVKDMERLVRRALALPRKPAVVLMHMPAHGIASYPPGHPKFRKDDFYTAFWQTCEDAEGLVSQYYDLPALSLRTALYDLAVFRPREGYQWEEAFVDHHPGDAGHKMAADLAVYLVQQTAIEMLTRPYGREDEEARAAPLPAPVYEGNVPPASPMCIMYGALRDLASQADGWEYTAEGTPDKPKPGFIATRPGAVLRFRVNTDRAFQQGSSAVAGQPVQLFFHYLKSYRHMGVASFSCVLGCTCDETVVDAHHSVKESQLFLAKLEASQSAECQVEVKVLDRTSSGEHKFKVAGLVVSEQPGGNGIMEHVYLQGEPGRFQIGVHSGEAQQVLLSRDGVVV